MNWWTSRPFMRGVNLGGWLLLERWMQESLFSGSDARDEYELCLHWGEHARERIQEHRETYITRNDFDWIAAHGLNAVRIPFGYWILHDDPPFLAGSDFLDRALRWCEEFGLMAILDLHSVVGMQSNQHHTGRCDFFRWPADESCAMRTLWLLEELAERYSSFPAVRGISLVNEPDPSIPAAALDAFYREAYRRIRRYMPYERIAVITSAFTEQRLREFHGAYQPPQFENVVTDVHYYQCFGNWFEDLPLEQHLQFPETQRLPEIREANERGWLMVGEWSLRLPWQPRDAVRELPPAERDAVWRQFGRGQLDVYGETQGWFFWSYKAENEPEWSYRACVDRGWLPGFVA